MNLVGLVPLPLERERERERDRARRRLCAFFDLDPSLPAAPCRSSRPLFAFSPFLKDKYCHRFFDNFFLDGDNLVPITSYFSFNTTDSSSRTGLGKTSLSFLVVGMGLDATILDVDCRQPSVRTLDRSLDELGSRVSMGDSGLADMT